MMYLQEPQNFRPRFEIVSCFLEDSGRFLLLRRSDAESQANTWGVVAGKVEKGEEAPGAMAREMFEETGIRIPEDDMSYWGKTFVRYQDYNFVYHMFSTEFPQGNSITLDPREHKDFRWVTPEEALSMPLIQDEDMSIKLFYKIEGRQGNRTG